MFQVVCPGKIFRLLSYRSYWSDDLFFMDFIYFVQECLYKLAEKESKSVVFQLFDETYTT
jgi:hypothetical protein